MAKSEPLRTNEDIEKIKRYFLVKGQVRNYALFTLGVNTALRIGDLLTLTWNDVINFHTGSFLNHITLIEQKTKKKTAIMLNSNARSALEQLRNSIVEIHPDEYLFKSRVKGNHPIHRSRAYTIIRNAAKANGIEGIICCHSMRKTFGYHAWKEGFPPAIIMEIYNHSSLEITKRYLSINQDDKDSVFSKLEL